MTRKVKRIKVRCTRGIALEMCRYDNSQIVSERLVDPLRWSILRTRLVERNIMSIPDINNHIAQVSVYDFTIEGTHHTVARWSSFGAKVTEV